MGRGCLRVKFLTVQADQLFASPPGQPFRVLIDVQYRPGGRVGYDDGGVGLVEDGFVLQFAFRQLLRGTAVGGDVAHHAGYQGRGARALENGAFLLHQSVGAVFFQQPVGEHGKGLPGFHRDQESFFYALAV